jgi:hypothetical protein
VPLDFRPWHTQRIKHRKGGHRPGLLGRRPSIRDFPIDWLPDKYVEEIRAAQREVEEDNEDGEEDGEEMDDAPVLIDEAKLGSDKEEVSLRT